MTVNKCYDKEYIQAVVQERTKWEQETLKGKNDTGDYNTYSGIPIKLIYSPEDVSDINYLEDIGFSGQPPFVRGVYPNMYRGRLFTVRQLAGFGAPEDCNKRIKFLLDHGATGASLLFDLPTIRGYDSDSPEAEGNVGQCGSAIDSLQDIEALFDGIDIAKVSSSIVTHLPSTTVPILSMYLVMAEKRGVDFKDLAGTNQNDFIMETAVGSGPEILNPRQSFRLQCDAVEYASRYLPRWNPISFNGYNLREAGTNAIQEVAIAIANAIQTAEEMIKRGLTIDMVARRMSFFWDLCNDFFEEIAKCRASRKVYYDIIKNRFKAQELRSCLMRFHVQTAGISLPAIEPLNNIARSAIQGLAAILGGAQSLHIDSYDEAFSAPTESAALISLRTQQILQNETNVCNTVDPLAGSYYVESLTEEMVKRINSYIEEIEKMGGLVKAVETGWLHQEIANHAYQEQKGIESGENKIVGVNCFNAEEAQSAEIEVFEYPATEERQKAKLIELRKNRDNEKVQACLNRVAEVCRTSENVMPTVKEAVREYATLGEIQKVFRKELGLWKFPLI
ncbi:MAG: methylmalonyl-CoA mutase [Peptococcaceae bacterium BRH_c4b]|nr:MAG: methylmalonyl-CoA mutase [Peptococcaceae bacterium BRH_c4b]